MAEQEPTYWETAERPREATVSSYEADERTVDAPTQTVAGQMEGLLENDSKWLTAARTRGRQYANARGMLNSSMGAGAVETAAIEAAMPVATQDAATFSQQARLNQEAANKARLENARFAQDAELFNVDFLNQGFFREQDTSNRLRVDEAQHIRDMRRDAANNAARLREIGLQNAGSMSVQSLRNSGALQQIGAQGKNDRELQAIINEARIQELETSGQIDLNLQTQSDTAAMERLNVSETGATERTIMGETGATERTIMGETGASERQGMSDTSAMERLNVSEEGASERNQANITSNEQISEAEMIFNMELNTSDMAHDDKVQFGEFLSETGQQYNIQQSNIAMDPNMSEIDKNRAMQNNADTFQGNVQTMADLYGIDISWTDTPGVLATEEDEDTEGLLPDDENEFESNPNLWDDLPGNNEPNPNYDPGYPGYTNPYNNPTPVPSMGS